ncbi:MAG: DUF1049 domain-containing protein [Alphaproteobacteria bacterium]
MLRLLAWLILLPLVLVFIAFAVANRHTTLVSFDPLPYQAEPSVYALALCGILIGLLVGGTGAWIRGSRWRRRARQAERRAARAVADLEQAQAQAKQASEASDRPALPTAA